MSFYPCPKGQEKGRERTVPTTTPAGNGTRLIRLISRWLNTSLGRRGSASRRPAASSTVCIGHSSASLAVAFSPRDQNKYTIEKEGALLQGPAFLSPRLVALLFVRYEGLRHMVVLLGSRTATQRECSAHGCGFLEFTPADLRAARTEQAGSHAVESLIAPIRAWSERASERG